MKRTPKRSASNSSLRPKLQVDELLDRLGQHDVAGRVRIFGIVSGNHRGPAQPLSQTLLGQVLRAVAVDDVADLVPSTPANWPGVFSRASSPSVMKTWPPGKAKALIVLLSART